MGNVTSKDPVTGVAMMKPLAERKKLYKQAEKAMPAKSKKALKTVSDLLEKVIKDVKDKQKPVNMDAYNQMQREIAFARLPDGRPDTKRIMEINRRMQEKFSGNGYNDIERAMRLEEYNRIFGTRPPPPGFIPPVRPTPFIPPGSRNPERPVPPVESRIDRLVRPAIRPPPPGFRPPPIATGNGMCGNGFIRILAPHERVEARKRNENLIQNEKKRLQLFNKSPDQIDTHINRMRNDLSRSIGDGLKKSRKGNSKAKARGKMVSELMKSEGLTLGQASKKLASMNK
jgi:hypothetical protein